MPLGPGVRLGAYEVVRLIGAGGMGEVYEARDTRLDRIVAIKVLPEQFAADPERRARFEREARAVAALNHPHICDLHDIGEAKPDSSVGADTIRFLIMERLDGQTLAERLVRGPLPLAEALRHAAEIADALDHAHQRGLIHRDLKPGNVMITKTGAKLLDFGLSKPNEQRGVAAIATVSPEDMELTAPGALLGTFPYMAPEILEGHEADRRADVFAFGAIVYEMVAGRPAFQSRTIAGLIGAILHTEPPRLSTLRRQTPPALDRLISRCLSKRPDSRWQSIRDVALELKSIVEHDTEINAPATPRRFGLTLAIGLGALVIVSVALTITYVRPRASVESSFRFALSAPDGLKLADIALAGPITISPDGRRVVFAAHGPSGDQLLWVRALDSLTAQPLAGTENGAHPFWSPDSQSIAFFAQRQLKRIRLDGGPPGTICDALLPRGGTWSRDGVIVFSAEAGRGLHKVSSQGGAVEALPHDGVNEERYWPSFLPDGRHFIYFGRPRKFGIYAASIDSGVAKLLLSDYESATYSRGYLLGLLGSARGAPTGTLLAHAFDTATLQVSGVAAPIAEDVQYYSWLGRGAFSASATGTLVYATASKLTMRLTWFDRRGTQLGRLGGDAAYGQPSLSADDGAIAVERVDPITRDQDLWLIDPTRDVASRLTAHPSIDFMPVLAPDATRVVFASARGTPPNLFHKTLSGSQIEERLIPSAQNQQPTDWSSDGRFVIYATLNPRTQWDLWMLPMPPGNPDTKPVPLLETEFNEHLGRLSPNGRWLAYVSDESGTNEVYVRRLPTSAAVRRISTSGGSEPRWRGDGKELYFLAADGRLMKVDVNLEVGFATGTPAALFSIGTGATRNSGYDVNYTAARDGQRFLVSTALDAADELRTKIVINWPAVLRR